MSEYCCGCGGVRQAPRQLLCVLPSRKTASEAPLQSPLHVTDNCSRYRFSCLAVQPLSGIPEMMCVGNKPLWIWGIQFMARGSLIVPVLVT